MSCSSAQDFETASASSLDFMQRSLHFRRALRIDYARRVELATCRSKKKQSAGTHAGSLFELRYSTLNILH